MSILSMLRRQPKNMAGLESGQYARRLSTFRPSNEHINTLLAQAGGTTLARARWLTRNNGYAANAIDSWAANVVGCGIKPIPMIDDKETKKAVQKLWLRWTDESDAEGLTDFYGQCRRVAREAFLAGECFLRFRPRFLTDGLSVPLQLQMMPAEMLPLAHNVPYNGNQIRQGIEFDQIGRRVAYHFYKKHPGDSTDQKINSDLLTRVPASEIIHVFDPVEAGQIRGLSKFAPAIVKMFFLDQYDDAELDRKKTAALFAGFITKNNPADALMGEGEEIEDGASPTGLQPATMQVLLPGEDVKFSEPADVGGNYEAFQYRTLLAISAALGLPYQNVSNDVMRANYSNIRAGLVEFRRRAEAFQHSVLVFQVCRPVWRRWMEAAVLAGALKFDLSPEYTGVKWVPPAWPWVDPLKDRQAESLAVRAGTKSRSQVVSQEGYDAEEIDADIAADNERADGLGLVFDTDPRRVTSNGQQQPAATDGPPAPDESQDSQRRPE